MTITLTHEQEAWIDAHVASGRFASVEDAIRQLIDERIAELDIEGDDLAWAKPLVDEARDAIARGDVLTLEEHRARNAKRLATLRKSGAGEEMMIELTAEEETDLLDAQMEMARGEFATDSDVQAVLAKYRM